MSAMRIPCLSLALLLIGAVPASADIGFDPLAPGGIAIGMDVSDAQATLNAAGFSRRQQDRNWNECTFDLEGPIRQEISFVAKKDARCEPGSPIRIIYYQRSGVEIGPLSSLADSLGEMIGPGKQCKVTNAMECYWYGPAGSPLVHQIMVGAWEQTIGVNLYGVDDLESRLAAKPEDQPWWEKQLAEAAARPEKFTHSDSFDTLSDSDKSRLAAEAEQVLDYCLGSGSYALLRDCRCVAGRFIDARASQYAGGDNHINTLVGIAQKAVKDRECPNKAGAAKKAHSDCVAVYHTSKGVEPFCACFAEVSAAMYMEEELLRLPGAGASLKCQDQGISIPD